MGRTASAAPACSCTVRRCRSCTGAARPERTTGKRVERWHASGVRHALCPVLASAVPWTRACDHARPPMPTAPAACQAQPSSARRQALAASAHLHRAVHGLERPSSRTTTAARRRLQTVPSTHQHSWPPRAGPCARWRAYVSYLARAEARLLSAPVRHRRSAKQGCLQVHLVGKFSVVPTRPEASQPRSRLPCQYQRELGSLACSVCARPPSPHRLWPELFCSLSLPPPQALDLWHSEPGACLALPFSLSIAHLACCWAIALQGRQGPCRVCGECLAKALA